MRTLKQIAHEHPALIYQARGYDEPDRAAWSDEDHAAFDEVTAILAGKMEHFVRFQNFAIARSTGKLRVRVQHNWNCRFTGVGYFSVDELDGVPI